MADMFDYFNPVDPIDPVETRTKRQDAKLLLCIDPETLKIINIFIGSKTVKEDIQKALNLNTVSDTTIRGTCNNNKSKGSLKNTLYGYYWIYGEDINLIPNVEDQRETKKLIFDMVIKEIKQDPNILEGTLNTYNTALKLQYRSLLLIRNIIKDNIETTINIGCLMGGFEESYICNCCNIDYRQYIKDKYKNNIPEAVRFKIYNFLIDYLIPDFYKNILIDLL